MPPERPDQIGNPETGERSPEVPFKADLVRLQEVVGPQLKPIPEGLNQQELTDMEAELIEDNFIESFNELFRRNELLYRRAALQRLSVFEQAEEPSEESIQELVVANRAATYHEYFQRSMNHVVGVLQEYETLRAITPDVPDSILRDEQKMKLYISALKSVIDERMAFSNILLIDAQLAQGGNRERLTELRERYMVRIKSEATRNALTGDTGEQWKRGNALNQRIIDLLAGKHGLQGLEEGFVPQRVYIDLLKHTYESLLERQKEIVRDPGGVRAVAAMNRLEMKLELSKAGEGEFTEADKERLESLRSQTDDRNAELDRLKEQRNETLQELIGLSDELAGYQLEQAELATIQQQFGENSDLSGATQPRPDTTPSFVREAMGENVEIRSNFHMERMNSMMQHMEENVLDAGWKEDLEDAWNKNGREAVRKVAHKISEIITIPLPGMGGVRKATQDALTESLDESLGWPPGKDTWEELSPEERQKIEERAKSILDAIEAFDRTAISRTRETIAVVQAMPDASEFTGQEVLEPLPTERVTTENMDEMIKKHGGATVYFMLFEQMEGDWGSAENGTGFMGEYKEFLEAINMNIDVKIDVSKAIIELSSTYAGISRKLLIAALIILGAGILTGVAAARLLSRATGGSLRLGGRLARDGFRQLSRFRNLRAPEFLTKLRYLKQERALANYLRSSRAGQAVFRLNVLRGTRFARGAGRLARGTGRVVKGLGAVAIPAIAAYEMHVNSKRKQGAQDRSNEELREEYASQDTTTLLETGGFAALLGISAGPAIVLGTPVWWAAEVSRDRSESRANWKREAADWMAEYSSSDLLQKLHDIAPGSELDTGDEALRTRGSDLFFRTFGYGEELDREATEAMKNVSNANAAARKNVYEAYFTGNLLVPDGTTKDEAARMVRSKVGYIRTLTHGGYERLSPQNLRLADVYAELVEMRHKLTQAGQPTMISYIDEAGERMWLNLELLLTGTRQEKLSIVADYQRNIAQLQELVLFNTLGDMANDHANPAVQTRERKRAQLRIRETLLVNALHDLHEAGRAIQAVDWPGVGVTGAEQESEMLVRWYVRFQITNIINTAVPKLMGGEMNLEDYRSVQSAVAAVVEEVRNIDVQQQDSSLYFAKSEQYFADNGGQENVEKALSFAGKNPLYALLNAE